MNKTYGSQYLTKLDAAISSMEAQRAWNLDQEAIYNRLTDWAFQISLLELMLERVEREEGPQAEWDDYELARLGLLVWQATTLYLQGQGSLEEIAECEREVESQIDAMTPRID